MSRAPAEGGGKRADLFAYASRMLPQVGPILALCWPQVNLRWPYLGLMLASVGPIFALSLPYVGPMLRHRDGEFCSPMLKHLQPKTT